MRPETSSSTGIQKPEYFRIILGTAQLSNFQTTSSLYDINVSLKGHVCLKSAVSKDSAKNNKQQQLMVGLKIQEFKVNCQFGVIFESFC